MGRVLNVILALTGCVLFAIPFLVVYLSVRLTSDGLAIHWSKRVGRDNKHFMMPKFRTMRLDTPDVATHLMSDPDRYLTPIGGFLRKTSLDELPQLWSVLKGDMAFVGPRPALYNQDDLIALRKECGVDRLTPGITGWAQVHGRDEAPIPKKVEMDRHYLERRSFGMDIKILWLTLFAVLRSKGVAH